MKTKTLLFSMAMLLTSVSHSLFAQETDATPSNFIFKNLEVGPYAINGFGKGANPSNLSELNVSNTVFASFGGAALAENVFNIMKDASTSGISIVNSEYGHILMIKGKDSQEALGTAASGSFSAFWNLNFVLSEHAASTKLRVTTQVKLVTATASTEAIKAILINDGNVLGAKNDLIFKGDAGWWKAQFDGTLGQKSTARIRYNLPGASFMDDCAFYIYELKITNNPEGLPSSSAVGSDHPEGVTTSILEASNDVAFVTWDRENVYINNAFNKELVTIYNMNGQQVYSAVANKGFIEIPLVKGAYLVKINNKTVKVII